MKKVLVSGYIGFDNFGDEAIFYALKNHLKDCKVEVLSMSKKYNKSPLLKILTCDTLISGGGSLLQNKTSNKSLVYYLLIIFLAKLFFKKVIIFAQGIEPIKGKFYSNLTKYILKMCDYISVRDKKTQQLLKNWNIKSNLVSDPVYSIYQEQKEKQGLVVQLRDLKNLKENFLDDLAKLIKKYYAGKITILALQYPNDEKICLDMAQKLNAQYVYYQNVEQILNLINSSKYIISTRLHGLIAGVMCACKTFALSYDDKTDTLIEELNLQNINIYSYNYNELEEKLAEFFKNARYPDKIKTFSWEEFDKNVNS